MKKAGCLFFMAMLLVSLCIAALYALREFRPSSLRTERHPPPGPGPEPGPAPAPVPEPPGPDPDKYEKWVNSLNEFSSRETSDSYRLSYGFIDHHGQTRRVECSILKSDHARETAAFGYSWKDLSRELDRRLQAILNRELTRRNIKQYVKVNAQGGGGYHWEYSIPKNLDTETYSEVLGRAKEMIQYLEHDYSAVVDQISAELYRERGFLLRKGVIVIDHGAMVLRNQLPLSDCFGALLRSGRGYNELQYLGMYLAFFQEIRYELPPDEINGKKVQGLYVPTEVLVNNHGDCDSKSIAFAAMMRSWMKSTLIIDLPDHVLAAVETRPRAGQSFVRIGNRYYVLCEVAGPGKLAPGNRGKDDHESGYFDYTLIDPISSELQLGGSNEGARDYHD